MQVVNLVLRGVRWFVVRATGPGKSLHILAIKHGYRVNEIADELECPDRRFHQIFINDVGLAPKRWLKEERMVVARRMLSAGRSPDHVSEMLGFTSKYNFRREFKAVHGILPTDFRQQRAGLSGSPPVDG